MSDTPLLELRFAARAEELRGVREAVERQARAVGCGDPCAGDIAMAVDEACQNIIRHAYGPYQEGDILLVIDREGDRLVFSLMDFAPKTDPAKVKPRDLEDVRPGGLGTFLIQEVMDEAEFVEPPPGCGNLLRMVKRIE